MAPTTGHQGREPRTRAGRGVGRGRSTREGGESRWREGPLLDDASLQGRDGDCGDTINSSTNPETATGALPPAGMVARVSGCAPSPAWLGAVEPPDCSSSSRRQVCTVNVKGSRMREIRTYGLMRGCWAVRHDGGLGSTQPPDDLCDHATGARGSFATLARRKLATSSVLE